MSSASQALPARARLAVSPEAFRRIATGAVGLLILIVATGATVRLTASGFGCKHWPGCQAGDPFPKKGYHSYIEFSNRIVAAITVFGTLGLAVASSFTRSLTRRGKVLAWGVFVGTLAQAPLGAITVYFDLNPWLVLSHLLLSLLVLGLGVLVVLEATRVVRGAGIAVPTIARAAGAVLLAAVVVLLVPGTSVTPAGPHPGGDDDRRLAPFGAAVAWHARPTAGLRVRFLLP